MERPPEAEPAPQPMPGPASEMGGGAATAGVDYTLEELHGWPEGELPALDPQRLARTAPAVVARYLERLEVDEQRTLLRLLPVEVASDILAEMDADDSAQVFGAMREERAVEILEDLEPDDAADVVAELTPPDRDRLLGKLEPETAQTVRELLTYGPETAGGVMNPEVVTVPATMVVEEAIELIRQIHSRIAHFHYVYVVNAKGHLLGVVSMRELILAASGTAIVDIMNPRLKGLCRPADDREEVALKIMDLNLLSLPVVDQENRLLGIVTIDDVVDIIHDEATEDMQKLVGAGGDESIHDDVTSGLRSRNPWLHVNLLTAFVGAWIIYLFDEQIRQLPLLAALMPVVASLGGNVGHQTLSITIRSIALGEVRSPEAAGVCVKETALGLLNGVIIGLAAALIAFVATFQVKVAVVILLAMILNMGLAGLTGAFIPLALKRLNFDPAQSSSIFLTAVTDMAGFFIFLKLGSVLLLAE